MSDQYRDGCSKKLLPAMLMMPLALMLYARDSYRVRRDLRKARRR